MLVKGNFLATGVLAVSDRIRWIHLGGSTSFSPSGFVLESSDGSGANTAHYFWARDADGLMKTHTSKPSSDSDGSIAASTGADTALSNVASVQIPNAGDLIPANDNQVTLGDATHGFSTAYLSTSLVFYESTNSLTIGCDDQGTGAMVVTIPDKSGTSLTSFMMLDTAALNSINYTNGTSSIVFGANADLDIAAGKTVNIDNAMTIQGDVSITAGLTVGGTTGIGAGGFSTGTGAVAFAGSADFNQADGVSVDINGDVTIGATAALTTSGAAAVSLDQSLAKATSPTFVGLTLTGAIATPTTITASSHITTAGNIIIDSDSSKLQMGDDPATDSYVYFNGTNLVFYDTAAGAYTLAELAASGGLNPSIAGDLSLPDGSVTIVDQDSAAALSVTNSTMTTSGTNLVKFDADALTTQCVLTVDATSLSTGEFISCDDGGAQQFAIKRYGEVEITGNAGADMITITDGDINVTDGSVTIADADDAAALSVTNNTITTNTSPIAAFTSTSVTQGILMELTASAMTTGKFFNIVDGTDMFTVKLYGATTIAGTDGGTASLTQTAGDHIISDGCIEIDANSSIDSHIKRNSTGSSTPVLTVENTHATGTGYAMLVTQTAAGGAAGGISVTNAGTSPVMSLAAGGARQGYGLHIPGANQLAEQLVLVDGALTAAVDEGSITVAATGVLAAGGNLLRLSSTGNNTQHSFIQEIAMTAGTLTGATDGFCLQIDDDSTAVGTSYAVNIDSNANEALKVTAGKVSFAEQLTVASGGVDVTGVSALDYTTITNADNAAHDALNIDQNDVTQNSDNLVLTTLGTGYGIKMTTETTTGKGAYFLAAANQTTSNVLVDGLTADWKGADDVGMVHLKSNAALADVGASLLYVTSSSVIDDAEGGLARFLETGTGGSGSAEYAVEIASTNNESLHVSKGAALFSDVVSIVTDAVTDVNLTLSGVQDQTTPLLKVDASTGNGWDGADDTGAIEITSDSVLVANGATLFRVESSATQKSGSEGYLARFENTGTAQAGAVAVEIVAKDETEVALKVGAGTAQFADGMTFGSVARAATADGTGTGQILQGESMIVATVTTNADDWLTLPTPVVGTIIWIASGTVALELRTNAPNTVAINGGVDTAGEMEIVNTDYLTRCVCIGTTDPGWIIGHFDEDGDYTKGDVAAD